MSKPRYNWWSHAKAIVRSYPELRAAEADLHQQRVTATYDGMPHGSGSGRGLEEIVTRTLPACKQRELDAVNTAIDITKKLPSGQDRLRMIDLVYWRGSHTLDGAAYKIHVHTQTAKNWNGDFIRAVGRAMGWMDGLE